MALNKGTRRYIVPILYLVPFTVKSVLKRYIKVQQPFRGCTLVPKY